MNEAGGLIWDASALLALLGREIPTLEADATSRPLIISAVNLSEVVAKLTERGMPAALIRQTLAGLPLDVEAFSADDALRAGELRAATRAQGLSLGDRACLALALRLGLPALTTDRAWGDLDIGVAVRAAR
jgi:PIN domain nuclease of toxin-antitoxin system